MSHRKTHDEFVLELSCVNPEVEVLGQYYTALTKVLLKCRICGNQWEAKPSALLHGSGCPECAKRRKSNALKKTHEQFVSELALVNSKILVLEHYTGNRNKLMTKCQVCNHEWKATPHDLLSGHGCPKCGLVKQQNAQRKTHEQFLLELEQVNPGIEILDEYVNNHRKVKFGCKICGHIWKTVPNSVLLGHGCPECSRSSTSFFEQVIQQAFRMCLGQHSVRNRDKTLIGMELDIYIPELCVAYEPGSWAWHKDKIERDTAKRTLCKEKEVKLITIYTDYKEESSPFDTDCIVKPGSLGYSNWEETKTMVVELLSGFGLTLCDSQWEEIRINALEKSRRETHQEFVEKLSQLNPNIEVIGKYIDSFTKIAFCCKVCGCQWDARPNSIQQNTGCPECGRRRINLAHTKTHEQFIVDLAKENSTVEIVGQYINSKTKIACQCCVCGNEWEMRPNALLRGQGCPKCGRKRAQEKSKKTHEQFANELVIANSKVDLIGEYLGSDRRISVRCRKCGLEWDAWPSELLAGHGCSMCYKSRKRTQEQFIEELYSINPQLEVLGQYINANTKLEIRCRKCGKEWRSRPHDLLCGHGCSICAKEKRKSTK